MSLLSFSVLSLGLVSLYMPVSLLAIRYHLFVQKKIFPVQELEKKFFLEFIAKFQRFCVYSF